MIFTAKQLASAYPIESEDELQTMLKIEKVLPKGLSEYLSNPLIVLSEKEKKLKIIFPEISPSFSGVIRLFIQNRKLKVFSQFVREYQRILKKTKIVISGKLITARPAQDSDINKAEASLARKFGMRVVLQNEVKADILGGAILKIEDKTVDKSYIRKLKLISQ